MRENGWASCCHQTLAFPGEQFWAVASFPCPSWPVCQRLTPRVIFLSFIFCSTSPLNEVKGPEASVTSGIPSSPLSQLPTAEVIDATCWRTRFSLFRDWGLQGHSTDPSPPLLLILAGVLVTAYDLFSSFLLLSLHLGEGRKWNNARLWVRKHTVSVTWALVTSLYFSEL